MLVPYTKPFLDIPGQIALLKSRGMIVSDEATAGRILERVGYYRLSAYWYPLRKMRFTPNGDPLYEILDDFRPNVEFGHAVDLYVFDKRLRLIFLDAIERIEVGLRVDLAIRLGARDPWAHRNASQLHQSAFVTARDPGTGRTDHDEWVAKIDRETERSREDFATHFKGKYSSPLPIWIAIELWDFGTLSKLLSALTVDDLKALAAKYNIPRWQLLPSWVRSINHIRNICAHHGRLWNRSPADQPKPPSIGEIPLLDHLAADSYAKTRIYGIAACMQYLLRTINPTTAWDPG